jgi:hypothetical protein
VKHYRRQTPVSSLFISNSGGDWRSTQNDGLWQAGSQVNNPCPVGFAFLLSRSGRRRLTLQIQAVVLHSKLVVAGRRFANGTFANAGDLAVYWSATRWCYDWRRPLLPAAPIENSDKPRKRRSTLPQRLAIILFFFLALGRNFIDVAPSGHLLKATTRHQGIC